MLLKIKRKFAEILLLISLLIKTAAALILKSMKNLAKLFDNLRTWFDYDLQMIHDGHNSFFTVISWSILDCISVSLA